MRKIQTRPLRRAAEMITGGKTTYLINRNTGEIRADGLKKVYKFLKKKHTRALRGE